MIGIVVSGITALVLVGLLFYFVGHKRKDPSASESTAAEDGPAAEHPPVYSDPRYSQTHKSRWSAKPLQDRYLAPGHPTMVSAHPTMVSAHPSAVSGQEQQQQHHRISELPAAYDPVEIYTPETGCEEPP